MALEPSSEMDRFCVSLILVLEYHLLPVSFVPGPRLSAAVFARWIEHIVHNAANGTTYAAVVGSVLDHPC